MIVALAGHVDHGKTSIVRALTGVDTDRLAEEKRRGLTIDLGFAYADFGGVRAGFVDVPGHHRFIHNMVAGIADHQHALLAIAADDGVMPQTREHLEILELLGVQAGVVAMTKTDRVSSARCDVVEGGIRALTAGTFLRHAEIIRVSAATGTGLAALRRHLARADRTIPACDRPFRLAVDRVFSVRGSGTVVTGTVVAGQARIGDPVVLASSGARLRVRGLRVRDQAAEQCRRGDRAGVNLAGAPSAGLARGDWLLRPGHREPVANFAMRLRVLPGRPPLKHNTPLHVHHASGHRRGRALLIDSASVPANATADIDVVCDDALHVKVGDRVVLRAHDRQRTLGGGPVLDIAPAAKRRRHPARLARLAAVRPDDAAGTLAAWVAVEPVDAAAFRRHWNHSEAHMASLARHLDIALVRGHWITKPALTAATGAARRILASHHRAAPASGGLTERELAVAAGRWATWMPFALATLAEQGAVRFQNGRHTLPGHRAKVPGEVAQAFAEVAPLLDSTRPPSLGDIAKRLKRPLAVLNADLKASAAFGLAVRVSANRYFLPARLGELADIAIALATKTPFTARAFRDAAGVGRNIAIEVLEHFDGNGFTRRQGDTRQVVGERARAM